MATPPKEPTQYGPQDDAAGSNQRMLEDFIRPTIAGLRGGLTIRENFRAYVTPDPITFTMPEDWISATFAPGWANAGGGQQVLQWRKGDDGRVMLRGRFTWPGGGGPASLQAIATLPTGWGPPALEVFLVRATGGQALLQIGVDRVLRWNAAFVNFTNIAASGVAFDASDRTPPALASNSQVRLPDVPFRPELVWVHATDPNGKQVVVQPQWVSSTAGITLERIPRLVPNTRYSLMVYALAG